MTNIYIKIPSFLHMKDNLW